MKRITTTLVARALPAIVVAALVAACGGGTTSNATTSTTSGTVTSTVPPEADHLVLRMDSGGGFVPVEFLLTDLPEFSMYADGRVIVPGPVPEIFPGPALAPLVEFRLSAAGVQAVIAAARSAGLFEPLEDYGFPNVADAPSTTFELHVGDVDVVTSVYALGLDDSGDFTPEQRDARLNLAALSRDLLDVPTWLGDEIVEPEHPYRPHGLAVFVLAQPPQLDDVPQAELVWPLGDPAAAAEDLGFGGISCFTVDGDDLDTVLPLVEKATAFTPWRHGDTLYGLTFRPLLPDEHGCDDLHDR